LGEREFGGERRRRGHVVVVGDGGDGGVAGGDGRDGGGDADGDDELVVQRERDVHGRERVERDQLFGAERFGVGERFGDGECVGVGNGDGFDERELDGPVWFGEHVESGEPGVAFWDDVRRFVHGEREFCGQRVGGGGRDDFGEREFAFVGFGERDAVVERFGERVGWFGFGERDAVGFDELVVRGERELHGRCGVERGGVLHSGRRFGVGVGVERVGERVGVGHGDGDDRRRLAGQF
jgi:hypothetical protein